MDEAMEISHIETKTAIIVPYLKDLVRKNKISKLKKFKGKIDLDMDLSVLRDRKPG